MINNEPNGEWSAYIDAVDNKSNKDEYLDVARRGFKIKKQIADILFPEVSKVHPWR